MGVVGVILPTMIPELILAGPAPSDLKNRHGALTPAQAMLRQTRRATHQAGSRGAQLPVPHLYRDDVPELVESRGSR